MTGCLYLFTRSAKAALSPCLTRSIRAVSASCSADIGGKRLTNTAAATRLDGKGSPKFQAPEKPQLPNTREISSPNSQVPDRINASGGGPTASPRRFGIRVWSFSGAWRSGFGVWVILRSGAFAHKLLSKVQGLLQKIEANAAARLKLPPGRLPAQELARYKG